MRNFKFYVCIVIAMITSAFFYACEKNSSSNSLNVNELKKPEVVTRTSNISSFASNDYKLWKLQNSAVSVLFPINNVGVNYVWIIQGLQTNSNESITTISNAILSTNDKKFLKLSFGIRNELHYLLTGATYQNYISNSVGIIRLENSTLLNELRTMNEANKEEIIDDIQAKATCKDIPSNPNPKGDESCKCAGGSGATECACGGSIASVSWSEQVSCGSGKYACCSGL